MNSRYILTLDIGSSCCKACCFDRNGKLIHRERVYYSPERTADGGAEINPAVWWQAVKQSIHALLSKTAISGDAICALSPIGHISTLVFLDNNCNPIRPALLYSDLRAWAEADEIYTRFSPEELDRAYGFHLPISPSWPLPRLLWVQRHEPETLERIKIILQPKDYIVYLLTGELITDPDSIRGILNYSTGKPDDAIFSQLSLPQNCFPDVHKPGEIVGTLSSSIAADLGLPKDLPVLTGWNDFTASVYGCGLLDKGEGFDITGTTEHIGCIVPHRQWTHLDSRLVHAPYRDNCTLLYGATLNSGGSLSWFTREFSPFDKPGGEGSVPIDSYEPWIKHAETINAGAEGLLFLPYLDGERAPLWDAQARGAFIGLRSVHTWKTMVRAVLEGVAFNLNQIFKLTESAHPVQQLRISGGYANLKLWNRIKASCYDVPLAVLETDEVTSLGAAILASLSVGWYENYNTAVSAMVRIREVVEPVKDWSDIYKERQEKFDKLYPALRSIFDNA